MDEHIGGSTMMYGEEQPMVVGCFHDLVEGVSDLNPSKHTPTPALPRERYTGATPARAFLFFIFIPHGPSLCENEQGSACLKTNGFNYRTQTNDPGELVRHIKTSGLASPVNRTGSIIVPIK
jgi:hypothetical protein